MQKRKDKKTMKQIQRKNEKGERERDRDFYRIGM